MGSVNDLETNVLNSAEGKVRAAEMPNIFSAYADTAYTIRSDGQDRRYLCLPDSGREGNIREELP